MTASFKFSEWVPCPICKEEFRPFKAKICGDCRSKGQSKGMSSKEYYDLKVNKKELPEYRFKDEEI